MKYIAKGKIIIVLVSIFTLLVLSGCSVTQNKTVLNNIDIEKISSMKGKITKAGLYSSEASSMLLRGILKQQFYVRGAQIPGYLRVELLNSKGKIIKVLKYNYGKKSNKLANLSFSVPIAIEPILISKIRVTHISSL